MRAKSRAILVRVMVTGVCLLAIGFAGIGCGGKSTEEEAADRQNKALHDPFGYSPDPKKSDDTVSGNGTFDKQGLKRDLDHVLNP